MTTPAAGSDRNPELAALAREHPGWEAWRGISGLVYARLHTDPSVMVRGEDVTDLNDQVIRARYYLDAGLRPPGC